MKSPAEDIATGSSCGGDVDLRIARQLDNHGVNDLMMFN